MQRLRRLERRSAPRRWCVVEVGDGWQGDVLVVRTRFGDPDTPPRLVSLAPVG